MIENLDKNKDRFREMPFDMPKDATDELDSNGNPILRNISLTSESPVMEYDHYEILDHSLTSANLDRVKGGAAWRDGHWGEQIGNMTNPRIDPNSKKLYVDVTFSQHNPNAMQTYREMRDGIKRNVSARVIMNSLEPSPESYKNNIPVYRSKDWQIVHGATVEDPADHSVGVNRELKFINNPQGVNTMEPTVTTPAGATTVVAPSTERTLSDAEFANLKANIEKEVGEKNRAIVERAFQDGGEKAALNISGILQYAKEFKDKVRGIDLMEKAQDFIRLGSRESDFATMITRNLAEQRPITGNNIGMSTREVKDFSFKNLIANKAGLGVNADREIEACNAATQQASKSGVIPKGIMIPADVLLRPSQDRKRSLSTATNVTGGPELIASNFYPENFIELVRNKTVIDKVGVMTMGGLVGNVVIPKQTGAATFAWVADGSVPGTESDQTFTQLTLSPKLGTANTAFSRQLLLQSTPSADTLIENDLAKIAALGKDLAVLHGTGANNQPTGISLTTGVGASATGSSPIDFIHVVGMETDVAAANLDVDTMYYVANATLYGALKTRPLIGTTFPSFILDAKTKEMNGFPTVRSNQVLAGCMFFGDFSQVIVGEWNGLDILVDPYTLSTTGLIQVTVFIYVDVGVRYAGAFSYASGIS
jgi:HK97 family phage major capsid protein